MKAIFDKLMKTNIINTTIFRENNIKTAAKIETLKYIGKGRASRAVLVKVTTAENESFECVEKIFNPGFLTKFIYWFSFQSPFAYQYNQNAIKAAFYRRKVASKILSLLGKENLVAEPYYTRWDEENQAYVLAAKFIKGRGIIPQQSDSFIIRRFLYKIFVKPFTNNRPQNLNLDTPPFEEKKEITSHMKKCENLFLQSGLVGSGWQVSTRALVATANLLRTKDKYVIIDLESGIPAFLIPYYLFRSLITMRFPYFDDLESAPLKKFIESNKTELTKAIGELKYDQLCTDVNHLITFSENWKAEEISVFRNFFSLFKRSKRKQIIQYRLRTWNKIEIIDNDYYNKVKDTNRLFTQSIFLLGIFPGRIGRFLRKLKGNKEYYKKTKSFFLSSYDRRIIIGDYVDSHYEKWLDEERISPDFKFKKYSLSLKFISNLFLGKIFPIGFHKIVVNKIYRKKIFTRIGLLFVSNKFQLEYSKYVIYSELYFWKKHGRISSKEFKNHIKYLKVGYIQEYLRSFSFHLGLKFFEAVTSTIKIMGIAWYLSTFASNFPDVDPDSPLTLRLMTSFLQTAALNPISILMIINTSVWRTLITLQRMISIRRRHITYRVALFWGMIPALGTLAYPMQLYSSCQELSIFLMRNTTSRIGQKFPIYGGKDSILELWFIKTINLIIEFLEITRWFWEMTFQRIIKLFKRKSKAKPAEITFTESKRKDQTKLDLLVKEHIKDIWKDFEI